MIPVGEDLHDQTLLKITRKSATAFEAEDLGAVRFVPLIGAQGWAEDGRRSATNHGPGQSRGQTLTQMIADAAEPLPDLDDPAFRRLFDRFADRRVVLLGEASHGTSEFYRARAAITRRLIEDHGFTIVAVEADWPDAAGPLPTRAIVGQGQCREPCTQNPSGLNRLQFCHCRFLGLCRAPSSGMLPSSPDWRGGPCEIGSAHHHISIQAPLCPTTMEAERRVSTSKAWTSSAAISALTATKTMRAISSNIRLPPMSDCVLRGVASMIPTQSHC